MRLFLKQAALVLVGLVIAYLAAWAIVYSVVMGGDYTFFAEYFASGWSGGGELPIFIQAGSLLLTPIIGYIFFFFYRSRKRRNKKAE